MFLVTHCWSVNICWEQVPVCQPLRSTALYSACSRLHHPQTQPCFCLECPASGSLPMRNPPHPTSHRGDVLAHFPDRICHLPFDFITQRCFTPLYKSYTTLVWGTDMLCELDWVSLKGRESFVGLRFPSIAWQITCVPIKVPDILPALITKYIFSLFR